MNETTRLLERLAAVAPQIAIQTIWEHNSDETWEGAGDWTDGLDPEDWQCWQSEVKATAIFNGRKITGSDYLGGTWEKACDHPAKSNPDISGYFPQMVEAALLE